LSTKGLIAVNEFINGVAAVMIAQRDLDALRGYTWPRFDRSRRPPLAKTFRCSIVTPAAAVMDEDVTYASFPAWDGQQGVMSGQSPLLTRLGVGSLRLDFPQGETRWYLVDSGFAQVQEGNLTLLTERAIPAEELSASEAAAELAEANARVPSAGKEIAKIEHDQRVALAKKSLAEQVKR
jgi:F-type H+-transporting ATPase subunit epsilon